VGDRQGEVLEVEARAGEGVWRRDRKGLRLDGRVDARSEVRSRHGWILVEIEDDGWYKPTNLYEYIDLLLIILYLMLCTVTQEYYPLPNVCVSC